MGKKENKEKKSWRERVNFRERAGVAHAAGVQVGAEAFLKHIDKYRIFMGPFFLVLMIIFLIWGKYLYGFISFGFMHISVMFNQLWWKLMMIDKKLGDIKE